MKIDIDRKDLEKAYARACDYTTELWKQGRALLEDYGVIEKRRRVWPWVSGALAATAVGAWYYLRRRGDQPA